MHQNTSKKFLGEDPSIEVLNPPVFVARAHWLISSSSSSATAMLYVILNTCAHDLPLTAVTADFEY